jgi:triosephosphate isomerase (TIM)
VSERKPIIAANWKMHHDHFAAIQYAQKLSYILDKPDYETVDVVLCPPFTDLRSVQTTLESDRIPIALGAQNCYWEGKGAFTGEVSVGMLAKLNVSYVIVGHSERRQLFGETDETVNKKVRAVLDAGLTPIVCVGETLDEREAGATQGKVLGQVAEAFAGVTKERVAQCVVAYEPIWAIGTGRNATPDDAEATIGLIRGAVGEAAGAGAADEVRIQYGGSVKPGNIADLMARDGIDGALVGGASLDPEEFARIVRFRVA